MVSEDVYSQYLERVISLRNSGSDINYEAKGAAAGPNQPGNLQLSKEEMEYGWAHKLLFIDELVHRQGLSPKQAECHVEKLAVLETKATISCVICMDDEVAAGDGAVLKECFHMFCK